MEILNNFNPSIKVKAQIHPFSVDFLDTTTFKGPDFLRTHKLDTKVFFKATDTHSLLYKTSYHPRHTYRGIVKSQLLQFHRICSRYEDFRMATKVLFSVLTTRGYSRSFLRKVQKEFLNQTPESTGPLLLLVVDYSTTALKTVRDIKRHFFNATRDRNVLHDFRIIPAFRRRKNLRDYLITARVPPLMQPQTRTRGDFFLQQKWITNRLTGQRHVTPPGVGLHSRNCVYVIHCSRCGLQYVGETGNTVAVRFYQYKHNILHFKNRSTPVIEHFITHGWSSLKVTVAETNPYWTRGQRKRAEARWMEMLGTFIPYGLNERGYVS